MRNFLIRVVVVVFSPLILTGWLVYMLASAFLAGWNLAACNTLWLRDE